MCRPPARTKAQLALHRNTRSTANPPKNLVLFYGTLDTFHDGGGALLRGESMPIPVSWSTQFCETDDPTASLLASLGAFGVGFVTRPIGGLVIGRMGDRLGRKPAMVFSFTLMGVAITALALTPSRAVIGIAAPLLVVFLRMLQGFALGGEIGPTTAFLLEVAPPERRGFYTAFQLATQSLAVLISGLVGFALASTLSGQHMQDFGWRLAFLLGSLTVPFGLMMRRSLPETFQESDHGNRERVSLRDYRSVALLGFVLLSTGTIGNSVMTYTTTYAIATLHMRANVAFGASIAVGLSGFVFCLASGALSDTIGRKPMMLVPGILLLGAILPGFYAIAHYRTTATLLVLAGGLSGLRYLSVSPGIIWLTESLPAAIRSSGVAIIYAVAIAVFNGTTQYVVTWLIKVTGNRLAPAWYWTGAAIISVVAICATRESAPCKVDRLGSAIPFVALKASGIESASE